VDVDHPLSRPPASRPGHHMVQAMSRLVCVLQCIEQRLGRPQIAVLNSVQLPKEAGIDRVGKDKTSKATTEDELTNLLRIGRLRRPALVTELGKVTVP